MLNGEMSELLDKKVDTQNENMKIKIPGFTQALVKCVMKIKESIRLPRKFFTERRTLIYRAVSEHWLVRFCKQKWMGQMVRHAFSHNGHHKNRNG